MSASQKQTDLLGGSPPNMDARMCGVKAFNVLLALSGYLIVCAVVTFGMGIVFDTSLMKLGFQTAIDAFWILAALYFLRSSAVYLCISACGAFSVCCSFAILGMAVLASGLMVAILPNKSSVHSTTTTSTMASLLKTTTMSPEAVFIVLVFLLIVSVINIFAEIVCTVAFYKLSGRGDGSSADGEQDRYAVKTGSGETDGLSSTGGQTA